MQLRTLWIVVLALIASALAGCGGTPEAAAPPATPVVVTQLVTQVVIQKETVVVTATRPPATPTPTAEPTPTPEPAITAKAIGETLLLASPEVGYKELAQIVTGDTVTVLYRGGEWIDVKTVAGVEGWTPIVRYDLTPETLARVPVYPEPMPVIIGHIVQEPLAGSVVFKGKVENRGGVDACGVSVEIETFGAGDVRTDLVTGYVDGAIPPGESRSFQAITSMDFESFVPAVLWSKSC